MNSSSKVNFLKAPSQNTLTAKRILRRTLLLRRVLDEAGVRGWVQIARDAGLAEAERAELVSALKRIWNRARSGIAAIGDERRATGAAVPLCWLPGDDDQGESAP